MQAWPANHTRPRTCSSSGACAGTDSMPDRGAPARMAAFTLDGFCAAAAVGRFLLITTVSQSWLPWRFTAGRASGWVGAGGSGGRQVGPSGQHRRPPAERALHCSRHVVPGEGDRTAAVARGRQWTAALLCLHVRPANALHNNSSQLHCSLVMAAAAGGAERSQNFLAGGGAAGRVLRQWQRVRTVRWQRPQAESGPASSCTRRAQLGK